MHDNYVHSQPSSSSWDNAISPPATEVEGMPLSQPRKAVVPFDRFIILNVEATCDFNPTNRAAVQVTKENAETIELAFAVMDVESGQVVHKQRILVKPERTPLTRFCTEITGIAPSDLEDAGDLWNAIQQLDSYIQEEMVSKNLRYCLVTHGGWVLRIQLEREARDKELVLPDTLTNCRMFDVKHELQRWQSYHQPDVTLPNTSLEELAKAFHLELVLTEDSNSLNACLTLASIIHYLTSFGYDDVFVRPIDLGEDMMEFRKQESRVVHLAGLPAEITQGELEAWFSSNGLRLATAYMIRPFETSKPSLSGFAFFPTHEDATKALALNGRQMGDRVVALSPCSERLVDAVHYMVCAFPVQANGRTRRIGDWGCPNCGFINFATRRSCLKCNLGNPSRQQSNMDDWICPNPSCGFSNFATRDRCHQCKMSRSGQPPVLPATAPDALVSRPGDWICPNPSCNIHNYATRPACRHCHTPKPSSSSSMSPSTTTSATTTPTNLLHYNLA